MKEKIKSPVNHPGLPEAICFELRCHGRLFQHGVVTLLGFGWRNVADGLQQPSIVEPVRPLQSRELVASNDRQRPRRWMISAGCTGPAPTHPERSLHARSVRQPRRQSGDIRALSAQHAGR